MSNPVCLMDEDLEVEVYYESYQQAAHYNGIQSRQVLSLIRHFPKKHPTKNVRFQYFHCLRQPEIWSRHPWLPVYVSSFGRIDKDGVKMTKQDKRGKKKGLEINGEWYTVEDLLYHTYPVLK